MKILIADDESVSRRMLQGLLTNWGYEVVSVEDGKAAWEQLNTPDAPRIALLDWMMPGRNGVARMIQFGSAAKNFAAPRLNPLHEPLTSRPAAP